MAATLVATGATLDVVRRGEDEEARDRVEVPGFAGRQGPVVVGEDLRPSGMVGGEALGVRFVERAAQWVRPTPSWQWGPPQCSTIFPSRIRRMAVPLISTGLPDAPTS